jgi:hypothetical protein
MVCSDGVGRLNKKSLEIRLSVVADLPKNALEENDKGGGVSLSPDGSHLRYTPYHFPTRLGAGMLGWMFERGGGRGRSQ